MTRNQIGIGTLAENIYNTHGHWHRLTLNSGNNRADVPLSQVVSKSSKSASVVSICLVFMHLVQTHLKDPDNL